MWTYVLDHHLDLIAFAVLGYLTTLIVHLWLRRHKARISLRAWLALTVLLASGAYIAFRAGENERAQLRSTVEGFAPTYALEMARMGHAKINFDTKPDDPTYLTIIEAEKKWEQINFAVNDIYTFRKTADGKFRFVVDSETDYDHDGKYEGDREQRTAIGETYDQDLKSFEDAVVGKAGFDDHPYADRWGVWVMRFCVK